MIVNQGTDPRTVPAMAGVIIRWAHVDANGAYSPADSLKGAQDMVNGYQMQNLTTAPALNSRHTAGAAIDMSISWTGTLNISNTSGTATAITTQPRTGMNADLATVGATYSVIKYNGSGTDRPHWSDTGR
jgi:hypothetical protein